jgi:hypothetical protein
LDAALTSVSIGVVGASVTFSDAALPAPNVRPPVARPPAVKSTFATEAAGSGHSAYGVGAPVPQTWRFVITLRSRLPCAISAAACTFCTEFM